MESLKSSLLKGWLHIDVTCAYLVTQKFDPLYIVAFLSISKQ